MAASSDDSNLLSAPLQRALRLVHLAIYSLVSIVFSLLVFIIAQHSPPQMSVFRWLVQKLCYESDANISRYMIIENTLSFCFTTMNLFLNIELLFAYPIIGECAQFVSLYKQQICTFSFSWVGRLGQRVFRQQSK